MYSKAIRVLSKGYLPISLLPPLKLEKILKEVRIAIAKSNKDYNLVLNKTLPILQHEISDIWNRQPKEFDLQFPVFVQPYTEKRLIMYQIETVLIPILDENEQVHSYTELKNRKTVYCIK